LEIRQTARAKQIAKAYKVQAMKWHPDKHTRDNEREKAEAEARFKQIAFAFSVLNNRLKRSEYDDDNSRFDDLI
jgi:curved DNA-binding protein CbpA